MKSSGKKITKGDSSLGNAKITKGDSSLGTAELEREEECGICLEPCTKMVLPNCCHEMCIKCYRNWYVQGFKIQMCVLYHLWPL